MVRESIATGDTIEKAVENGRNALKLPKEAVDYEVLEYPVKKVLGLFGGNPAKVRVFAKIKTPGEKARDYLTEVVVAMGIDAEARIRQEDEETSELELYGSSAVSLAIGHRGETLDALQYLACLVANEEKDGYHRVVLDVGEFRAKRKETLETLAERVANKAKRTGKLCSLEPMNPYERRILHGMIRKIDGVVSWSDGKEQKRHVVIAPEEHYHAKRRMARNSTEEE